MRANTSEDARDRFAGDPYSDEQLANYLDAYCGYDPKSQFHAAVHEAAKRLLAQSAELASLRARCDAAEKDAERYRRLRAPDAYKSVRILVLKEGRWYQSDGDCYLDNNVDALTAERAKEGETRK